MKAIALLFVICTCLPGMAKTDSELAARKTFASEYQQAIEKSGWPQPVLVAGKAKDVLQIWMPNAAVDAMQRFEQQFVEPYKAKIKVRGFRLVEIKTDNFSATFPKGVWDIPLD